MVGINRHRQTTPVAVEEEPLPRRRQRQHGVSETAAIYEEVEEAVEMDKQRGRRRVKRMLFGVIFVLVVSAIGRTRCDRLTGPQRVGRGNDTRWSGLCKNVLVVICCRALCS